jgi:precorrin-6A/cobalt-precorrin-6A reductase
MRLLLLGGTLEARTVAQALAISGIDAVYSTAGRTEVPLLQPLAHRIGGFGGVEGLRTYIDAHQITHVIDATHPFAAQMSQNAFVACGADIKLLRLERAPWQETAGDSWLHVPNVEAALGALPTYPARVFLAIGKQNLTPFAQVPQHFYLLRLVDPAPEGVFGLQSVHAIIDRGPFDVADDLALLRDHQISHIVAKNSGGTGARAKREASQILGLPVLMIDRPTLPQSAVAYSVTDVFAWLGHSTPIGTNLGV